MRRGAALGALGALGVLAAPGAARLVLTTGGPAGVGLPLVLADRVLTSSTTYGPQAVRHTNVTVRLLSLDQLNAVCAAHAAGDQSTAADVLLADIIVFPKDGDYTCNGALPTFNANLPNFFCQFADAVVRVDTNEWLGLWSNINYGDMAPESQCAYLVAHPSDTGERLLLGEKDLPLFQGNLDIDANDELEVIRSFGVQLFLRGVFGCVYLFLSGRATFVFAKRYRAGGRPPFIPTSVLTIAAVSMLFLAIGEFAGTHYITSTTSVPVVVLTFGALPGVTSALDAFLAANYYQVSHGVRSITKTSEASNWVIRSVVVFSFVLITIELMQAALFLTAPSTTTWTISMVFFPAFAAITQVAVTCVLVVQQERMSKLLLATEFPDSSGGGNGQILRLERHLRFWVRVSIAATVVQFIPATSMATDVITNVGPGFWIFNLTLLKLAKTANTLSQIQSFAFVPQPRSAQRYFTVTTQNMIESSSSSALNVSAQHRSIT